MKVVLVLLAIVVIVVGIGAGATACQYHRDCTICNAKTSQIRFPHRNLFWGGCQVFVNGSWMPIENYRYMGD